jgi:hypothetical protein
MNGNNPAILARLTAHTRAVQGVLHTGAARGHCGNPAAAMRLQRIYGIPVLLSGLPSLVLSRAEISTINTHFRIYVEALQKLYRKTPECVVYFLGGILPGEVHNHIS